MVAILLAAFLLPLESKCLNAQQITHDNIISKCLPTN
jgi:hypothetical protein